MPRALLYREAKHLVWYLTSCAMRSPALSLARSGLSCNLRAHCLTWMSSWNVDAWRKAPPPDWSQKKHFSVEGSACSVLWRVGLRVPGHLRWVFSSFQPFGVWFCCIATCRTHAIWPCEISRLSQCLHSHQVVTGLISLVGIRSSRMLQDSQQWSCIPLPPCDVLNQLGIRASQVCLPDTEHTGSSLWLGIVNPMPQAH